MGETQNQPFRLSFNSSLAGLGASAFFALRHWAERPDRNTIKRESCHAHCSFSLRSSLQLCETDRFLPHSPNCLLLVAHLMLH